MPPASGNITSQHLTLRLHAACWQLNCASQHALPNIAIDHACALPPATKPFHRRTQCLPCLFSRLCLCLSAAVCHPELQLRLLLLLLQQHGPHPGLLPQRGQHPKLDLKLQDFRNQALHQAAPLSGTGGLQPDAEHAAAEVTDQGTQVGCACGQRALSGCMRPHGLGSA